MQGRRIKIASRSDKNPDSRRENRRSDSTGFSARLVSARNPGESRCVGPACQAVSPCRDPIRRHAHDKVLRSFSPSPRPSPAGRGGQAVRATAVERVRVHEPATERFPLPAGEGQGEGERRHRSDACDGRSSSGREPLPRPDPAGCTRQGASRLFSLTPTLSQRERSHDPLRLTKCAPGPDGGIVRATASWSACGLPPLSSRRGLRQPVGCSHALGPHRKRQLRRRTCSKTSRKTNGPWVGPG